MTKKVKKTKKNGIADENSVDEKVKAVAEENVNVDEENIGTPSYEELLDTKEDLEQALLRANADLDNAIKRTISEVEKAHKYGVEKLLNELLPVIDNLEHALSNLSDNASDEDLSLIHI